ncbi:MAG: DUF2141 domain-containing protein [Bacteroidia bacterium]
MRVTKILFIASIVCVFSVSCKKNKDNPSPAASSTTNGNNNPLDSLSYIVINLNGMKNTNGKINVAVYNSEQTFNDPNQAYRELFLTTTGGNMIINIDSLPAGQYAFGIFHDENDNATIDANFVGIPQEGFAFSNNALGSFGPPTWAQAQFDLPLKSTVTQSISLKFY